MNGVKPVASNRRATHDYAIVDRFEAGGYLGFIARTAALHGERTGTFAGASVFLLLLFAGPITLAADWTSMPKSDSRTSQNTTSAPVALIAW